ncbi:hypothetical protein K4A87_11000 [Xanthomonas fragariae]|uniref:hypothetical protein n=1 Tax=Xanthomonas fragariae TaxID=48664 RepID=UPI001ABE2F72|nr:hypothetical protein [Xanthomonas fragariae]UKR51386.1 hypothetical protein K4A87_11000 [Xanthomonas fragariae]
MNVAPVDGVARGSSCPEDDSNDALTLLVREGRNLRPLLQRNLSQWQLLKNDVCSTATGRVVSEHAKWSLSAADYAGAGAVHRAEREQRHDRPWTQERILRPSKHAARGRWCMQR